MPLVKSKSDKAFKQNVRTLMHEDRPQKQALAIAYSTKRRAAAKGAARRGQISSRAADKL